MINNHTAQRSRIEIDLSAFERNLHTLKSYLLKNQQFLMVVKADAYGHGAYQIAKLALKCGASMLGVANIDEAAHLRAAKITAPILILSPSLTTECEAIAHYNIIPTVSEIEFCYRLNEVATKKLPVHLKIDTGMNRNGIKPNELPAFLAGFALLKNLYIQGIFSHFAASDDDEAFTQEQYEVFTNVLADFSSVRYQHLNTQLKYTHIANSAALLQHNAPQMNLVRFGLMAYGYHPERNSKPPDPIAPIMSYKSQISHLSTAEKGETIGYNRTFIAQKDLKYAIIPVGYADGYDLLLSNKGLVEVQGTLCPVLGKVSMDMLCIDVSAVKNVKLYQEVALLSSHLSLKINAHGVASLYNSSVYELLCQVGRRAKRYYFYNDKLIDDEPMQRRSFIPKDYSDKKLNTIIKDAIAHRLQSDEVSNVIYRDVIKPYITDSDRDVAYRTNFKYSVTFSYNEWSDGQNPLSLEGKGALPEYTLRGGMGEVLVSPHKSNTSDKNKYYKVKTTLTFSKTLKHNKFFVVCANDNQKLQYFFKQKKCEYRWLLDKNLAPESQHFLLTRVAINNHEIKSRTTTINDCIVYTFADKIIKTLKGKRVKYYIEAETLYPKSSNSLTIYINELTKGVEVNFNYFSGLFNAEATAIFSGRERFPQVTETEGQDGYKTLTVRTNRQAWVIPNSAIVISFKSNDNVKL